MIKVRVEEELYEEIVKIIKQYRDAGCRNITVSDIVRMAIINFINEWYEEIGETKSFFNQNHILGG